MPDFIPPRTPSVEIRTVEEAVEWGDGWTQAHRMERQARLREIHALHDEIFWLKHRASVLDFTITLLRIQLREAGVTLFDERVAEAA